MSVVTGPSTRSGDGQVTITYDPATHRCPEPATTTTTAVVPVVVVSRFTG